MGDSDVITNVIIPGEVEIGKGVLRSIRALDLSRKTKNTAHGPCLSLHLGQTGLAWGKPGTSPRNVDGLVDVMDDRTRNFDSKLTHARLCNWQAALFPGGRSGLARIEVGKYRTHADPIQIVSGRPGNGA